MQGIPSRGISRIRTDLGAAGNPATENLDFGFTETVFFRRRHLAAVHLFIKQAFPRLPGDDHWTGFTPFENACFRAEVEVLPARFAAMTSPAFGLQERSNVIPERCAVRRLRPFA